MRYVEPFVGGAAVFFGLKGAAPFLRWVGGKRKLFAAISESLWPHAARCESEATYPYTSCQCHDIVSYLIADANPDLVAAYMAVRDDVEGVAVHLKHWPRTIEKHKQIRNWVFPEHVRDHGELVLRATRMIYLNLYSHGGLFRTNAKGLFNVPPQPDRFTSVDLDAVAERLREASKALQGVDIRCADFSTTLAQCGCQDVVYCDPDYLPDATSKFVGYTTRGKYADSLAKHQALALDVLAAVQRGARVVISNSPAAASIYRAVFDGQVAYTIDTVSASRSIGIGKGAAVKRRQDEILVTVSRR